MNLRPSAPSLPQAFAASAGLAGCAGGAAFGFAVLAESARPELVGAAWGMLAMTLIGTVAYAVTVNCQAEQIRTRAAMFQALPTRTVSPAPATPETEPVYPELNPIRRNANGQIAGAFAADQHVYVQEADGAVSIYGVQVTAQQLDRLHAVVSQPRKPGKLALVYDDFVRGNDKVFSNGTWKKFQADLVDQHVAVWGGGGRCYLTERGRRVVARMWADKHHSPTGKRITVKA